MAWPHAAPPRGRLLAALAGAALAVPACALAVATARALIAERRAFAYQPTGPMTDEWAGHRPAIVVLGAETLSHGPSRALAARLDHALHLREAGVADVLVMAGGVVGELDEVAAMIAYARDLGVPEHDLVEGRPGQNTREQLATTLRLVDAEGLGPFIAVSTAFHAARVEGQARRIGLPLRVSAPAQSPEMRSGRVHRTRILTEAVALLWYALPVPLTSRISTRSGSLRHRAPLVMIGELPLRALVARPAPPTDPLSRQQVAT